MQSELLPPSLAMMNMQEREIDAYSEYDDVRHRSLHRQRSLHLTSLERGTRVPGSQLHSFDDRKERKQAYLGLETLSSGDTFVSVKTVVL